MATISESSGQLALRDPDVRLMHRVRDDEPGAFQELVELYQQRLLSVLTHLVGRSEEAEDLAQEVFLRVYRARKKYHARSKFSTWLFTIANNLALNALRSRQRGNHHLSSAPSAAKPGPRPIITPQSSGTGDSSRSVSSSTKRIVADDMLPKRRSTERE